MDAGLRVAHQKLSVLQLAESLRNVRLGYYERGWGGAFGEEVRGLVCGEQKG
jgi:hypothetical protein